MENDCDFEGDQDFSFSPELIKIVAELNQFKEKLGYIVHEQPVDKFGNLISFHNVWQEMTSKRVCCVNTSFRIQSLSNNEILSFSGDTLTCDPGSKKIYQSYADFEREAIVFIEKQLNVIAPIAMKLLRLRFAVKNQSDSPFSQAYHLSEIIIRKECTIYDPTQLQEIVNHVHWVSLPNERKEEMLTMEQKTLKYGSGLHGADRISIFKSIISNFQKLPSKPQLFDLSVFYRMPIGMVLIKGLPDFLAKAGNLWPNNLINVMEWLLVLLNHALVNAQNLGGMDSLINRLKQDFQAIQACIRVCYSPMFLQTNFICDTK